MKKTLLLIALGLATAFGAQAQKTSSPWTGSTLPEEGGTYYLYNVESGLWLQHNRKDTDSWTTRAQLDKTGFDIIITPYEDEEGNAGWQLDPRFGHNHSINAVADQGYMDTGNPVTVWTITSYPDAAGYSATNLYTIEASDGVIVLSAALGFEDEDTFISYDYDGYWQLVSKEERMADMMKATKDKPKDATWLIDDWDFANQNDRAAAWKNQFKNAGNNQINGVMYNRAVESWSNSTGSFYQDITGLPNGTYGLTLQGYYRDSSTGGVGAKHNNGNEVIRAFYFANEVSAPLMSICDNGATEPSDGMFPVEVDGYYLPGDGGSALPNASNAFFYGYYWNEEIQVMVTNGTLRIGVSKSEGVSDDWTVFDNFKLTYYGDEIDVTAIRESLLKLIGEAEAFEGYKPAFFTDAIALAKKAAETTDAEAIGTALQALNNAFNVVNNAADDIKYYQATLALCKKENKGNKFYDFSTAIAQAEALFNGATSTGEYSDALSMLQIARKLNNAERGERLWEGCDPEADQKYYIYNVGQGRFLCGGDDWGAHAALGWPGIEIGVELSEEAFRLNTYLNNGGDSQYLNWGGYMDTGGDNWVFEPLDNGVFNIARAEDPTLLLGWRPGTSVRVDTDLTGADDPNNQWIFVTREQRDAAAEKATVQNPVDMSYRIGMPNFSQRENWDESGWNVNGGSIWNRGANMPDFAYECWNQVYFDMNQVITDLDEGFYEVTVQGYYRDGDHNSNDVDGEHIPGHIEKMVNGEEPAREAYFYFYSDNDGEIQLPSLTDEANNAPGQGAVTAVGEVPEWIHQAVNYFQNNLYKVSLLAEVGPDGEITIGVTKDYDNYHDWVVVDNFRLIYYGTEDPSGIQEVIEAEPVKNGRLYNLQGVEVTSPVSGIYVRDGRKIVIR